MKANPPILYGLLMIVLFGLSIIITMGLGHSLIWPVSMVMVFSLLLLRGLKVPLKTSGRWVFDGVKSAWEVYLLIAMIGLNVSVWIASGIVPMLIYYGFDLVYRVNFLPMIFIVSGILAFFLGTGLGTLSTIGIVFYTIGSSMGIHDGVLVGTLISGAYIADRLSPMSALVNFTIKVVRTPFNEYFFRMIRLMAFPILITLGLSIFLGRLYQGEVTVDEVQGFQNILKSEFTLSITLLIMPVGVLILSVIGMSTRKVLTLGILAGIFFAFFIQQREGMLILRDLIFGYRTQSPHEFLQTLEIGGVLQMVEVIVVVAGGVAFSQIFDACGWIAPLISRIRKKCTSRRTTILHSGIFSILLNAMTCDQTVGILIPGKHLKAVAGEYLQDDSDFAAVIANTGTSIAPLMPWNVNAVIIFSITGVAAWQYAPFAVLNYLTIPFLFYRKS